VIIVEALRALAKLHALDNTSITVVFTGDEEKPGSPLEVTRAELVSAAKRSDLALGFEGIVKDREGKDTATIGRRAASGWMLTVTGKPGHSSGVFSESSGFGAIYEGARILNAFREQVAEADLTFNPGAVVGGTEVSYDPAVNKGSAFGKTNVIAASFRAQGDLRYLTYGQRDRAHAREPAPAGIVFASQRGCGARCHRSVAAGTAWRGRRPVRRSLRRVPRRHRRERRGVAHQRRRPGARVDRARDDSRGLAYLSPDALIRPWAALAPGNGDYFASAGKAGSLPMSRRSCWMITVALRFAAIFFNRSSDATVCARS